MSTDAGAPQSTGGTPQSTGGTPQSTGGSPQSSAAQFLGWGDGWRDRLAAGSTDVEKDRKQLERYESPEQIWKKARELERKLSSGEMRSTLPKDATAAEVAAWRKDNGVPEKPEDYKVNLPAGAKPPAQDDAFLKAFLKSAHEANYTQAQVDKAMTSFYSEIERQAQVVTEEVKKAMDACEDTLRKEWGGDYRANKAMAENCLARAPQGFKDRFMNGQLEDGTPIKASTDAWKWIVQLEREANPAATVVPAAGGEPGKAIAEEIAQIKTWMAAPKNSPEGKKYWGDEKMQERYRQLLGAEERLKAKATA